MPNFFSSIGRSNSLGKFVEELRLNRQADQQNQVEQERLGLLKNADARAGEAAGLSNQMTKEQIYAAKMQNEQARTAYEEDNKDIPIEFALGETPNKGTASVMEEYFKTKGLVGEIEGQRTVKNRYIKQYKADALKDPVWREKATSANVISTKKQLDAFTSALESKDGLKQLNEMLGENIKEEELPAYYESARLEYINALNLKRDITEKDRLESESKANKPGTVAELTQAALSGNKNAQAILDSMEQRETRVAGAKAASAATERLKAEIGGDSSVNLGNASESMKRTAKLLTDYKIDLPSGFALKSPYWQNVLALAEEMDPNFDGTLYKTRLATKKAFTSGKEARNKLGLNTAVGHIGSLIKAFDSLDNTSWQSANAAMNALAKHLPVTSELKKRQGKVTSAKTKFNAVKDELASIFKQSGATDISIKSWEDTITSPETVTPESAKAFISGALELMGSRLSALSDLYESGFGSPKDFHLLSQQSRNILKEIGVDADSIDPVYNKKNNTEQGLINNDEIKTAGPKNGDIIKGYRFKGGNPADKNNWEKM